MAASSKLPNTLHTLDPPFANLVSPTSTSSSCCISSNKQTWIHSKGCLGFSWVVIPALMFWLLTFLGVSGREIANPVWPPSTLQQQVVLFAE